MSTRFFATLTAAALVTIAGQASSAELQKGPHHTIETRDAAVTCSAGKECAVVILLKAGPGYHINQDYPGKFKAEDLAGVEFMGTDAAGKNVFSKAAGDFKVDNAGQATLTLKIKAAKAGAITLGGNFKFCVCSEKECVPDQAQLKIAVTVK